MSRRIKWRNTVTQRQRDEIFVLMSGNYLAENLPDNFQDMDDADLDQFIKDNPWEPLEYWSPSQILDVIDAATLIAVGYIERNFLGNCDE